jgi:hypothetical protein
MKRLIKNIILWSEHFQAQFDSQVSMNTHHGAHVGKNPQHAKRIMTGRLKNQPAYKIIYVPLLMAAINHIVHPRERSFKFPRVHKFSWL